MTDLATTVRNVRRQALPTPAERRALLDLAVPIVVVQVGMMLMGVVDTIMVGHLSATALAAVALGNLYYFGCVVFGMGTLMALDPVIAQAVGAGDHEGVARGVQRGLVLSLLLALPASAAMLLGGPALTALGQPAEVVPLAADYARFVAPSAWPFYVFLVLRQSLQALHRTRPIVISIVLANLLNVALDWALIYGRLGAPALGVRGAALATTIGRWVMPALLLALAWHELRPALRPWRRASLDAAPLGRMLRLGAPIGFHTTLEYTAFGGIGLLMGRLGTIAVAAHQVALNLASLTFMVPLGVASAAAVLVGRAIGGRDMPTARRQARAALVYGVGFMALTAVVFLAVPALLAGVYTRDAATLALAVRLIPIAGWFQLADGTQVVAAGILRGAGDTRVPMLAGLVGFWGIGIPVSLLLGFTLGRGPAGLWWGLAGGLAAVALFLVARVRMLLRRDLQRVALDGPAHH